MESAIYGWPSKYRGGPPKWMVYNGKLYFLMDDLGVPLFVETPIFLETSLKSIGGRFWFIHAIQSAHSTHLHLDPVFLEKIPSFHAVSISHPSWKKKHMFCSSSGIFIFKKQNTPTQNSLAKFCPFLYFVYTEVPEPTETHPYTTTHPPPTGSIATRHTPTWPGGISWRRRGLPSRTFDTRLTFGPTPGEKEVTFFRGFWAKIWGCKTPEN